MAEHKFEGFDPERFNVVVGVVRGLGLSFYTIDESLQVIVTSDMTNDDYAVFWDVLDKYNTRPNALPMP